MCQGLQDGRRQKLGVRVSAVWGRLFVRSGPLDCPRLCPASGGSFRCSKPQGRDSSLHATFPRDLPGPHQPATSFAGASPQVSGCCLRIFGAPGSRKGTGPPGKEMSGPPRVLLGPLPVTGGSREDSSEQLLTFPGVASGSFSPYGSLRLPVSQFVSDNFLNGKEAAGNL